MGRLSGFTYREITKRLTRLGFVFDKQGKGSHEFWRNPGSGKYTMVPKHRGDMPEGTLRAILHQAGIDPDEFLQY